MKPELFRKLIENKLIKEQVPVAVEYQVYDNGRKKGTVKGLYTISRLYAHPLILGTQIEVTNEKETVVIEPKNIKLISGLAPVKLAAKNGIRPDGKDNDAPKRRGRKPKIRDADPEFNETDFMD